MKQIIDRAKSARSWFERQQNTFGLPFLACICAVYFAQGFRTLSGLHCQLYLKDTLGMDPGKMQALLSLSGLPWSLKPLYGLVSDAYPLFGQHRKSYLMLGAVIGSIAWIGLAILAKSHSGGDDDGSSKSTSPLLFLLILSNLSTALSDVMVDAMVAEKAASLAATANAKKKDGGIMEDGDNFSATEGENALQSLCWSSLAIGGLSSSIIGVVLPSSVPTWIIFLLTASCPLIVFFASMPLVEKRSGGDDGGGTTIDNIGGILARCTDLIRALRMPQFHLPLSFFFLQNALVPSCHGIMLFFLTEKLGFTTAFMSANGVVAYIALLLGSAFGGGGEKGSLSFRSIFFRCQLALAVLSLADLILVLRLNVRFGIPDVVFVLGTDAISSVLSRVALQPFLLISARLCPKGCEASLFAFFMSTWNLGNTASGTLGAAVMGLLGVSKDDYTRLPLLLLVRTVCMLLPLPLVGVLIKEGGDGDDGEKDKKEEKVKGKGEVKMKGV